jgi:hypothetical protein
MFVPPYQVLLEELRPASSAPREADDIVIPRVMFELMLRLLVEKMPFDKEDYLKRNPDVAEALSQGKIKDARQHFITKGYFEGRVGGAPRVDEKWYQRRYADVAVALEDGGIASATDHYVDSGTREWRSPTQSEEPLVNEWKRVASATAANVAVPPIPLPEVYLNALKRRG